VFKTELNTDGSTGFKARLVIKAINKSKGYVDFSETFAPVSKVQDASGLRQSAQLENRSSGCGNGLPESQNRQGRRISDCLAWV
jgi:hypothetical protein